MAKSPSFRFYPSDFLGSPDVQAMELHEVGSYVLLLSIAWQSERHGYLQDDDEKLRRWSRMTRKQWTESRDFLLSKFPVVEAGWRANPRMVHEAQKQVAYSATQSAKGRKGGRGNKLELLPPKPELSSGSENQKPELSSCLSPVKPSVSVSVSENPYGVLATAVLSELGLAGSFTHTTLSAVCRAELSGGRDASQLKPALIAAYREYEVAKPNLRFVKTPEKFFGDGDWRDRRGWAWKEGAEVVVATRRYSQAPEREAC